MEYVNNKQRSEKYNNIIPYFDAKAYLNNPKHNWIYNKLELCKLNNVPCYPEGVLPKKEDYPIFSKPIMNFSGFSRKSETINNEEEYLKEYRPGNFWTIKFKGEHLIYDLVINKGKILYYGILKATPGEKGTFKMFETMPNKKPTKKIINFVSKYLNDYQGPLNLEMINDNFIEAHLRFNGDNYAIPENIFKETSILIEKNLWNVKEKNYNKKEYIFPIFGDENLNINFKNIINILKNYDIITWRLNNEKKSYVSPGGKRYIIFNINNKEKGLKLRKELLKEINRKDYNYVDLILIIIIVLIIFKFF